MTEESVPGSDPEPTSEDATSEDAAREVPERPAERTASPDEVSSCAREFVEGLLDSLDLEATVDTEVEEGRVLVEVAGEDLGVLIGRRGQTLDALQELTRTAVQRRLKARVRLLVDVEAYRARRRATLAQYAKDMAERAIERGSEIELEPMSSYERKIVHDAVGEVDGAASFSEGEEPDRRVVIRAE